MWFFKSPQIVFGEGALSALDEIEGKRALMVTDAVLVKLGLAGKVESHLLKAGLDVEIFDQVEPDPSVGTVLSGVKKANEYQPDWIVGLGGGSPMDAAKAIWVLYERPDLEPEDINPFIQLNIRRKARMIAVPTTSGTGAEVTWAIVLTDTKECRKMSLGNRENLPDMAIVDPELVIGMPEKLTVDTGMDALTHAVEGYTCTWHTDLTDGLCVHAVRLIFEYLPLAVEDGNDSLAREKMHNAATIAGMGFGNALASMAHAMGHSLGALFHIPHGCAVGLLLPYTIEFMAAKAPERFAELGQLARCCTGHDEEGARALARVIRGLANRVGCATSISELGIDRKVYHDNLAQLVEMAFNDASILTSTRSPSFDDLTRIYQYAYDGKDIDF